MQNGIDEDFASLVSKVQYIELSECVCGGLLRTGHDEFGDGGSTQSRRSLNDTFLSGSHTRLQALLLSSAPLDPSVSLHGCLFVPIVSVRGGVVQEKKQPRHPPYGLGRSPREKMKAEGPPDLLDRRGRVQLGWSPSLS